MREGDGRSAESRESLHGYPSPLRMRESRDETPMGLVSADPSFSSSLSRPAPSLSVLDEEAEAEAEAASLDSDSDRPFSGFSSRFSSFLSSRRRSRLEKEGDQRCIVFLPGIRKRSIKVPLS